MNRTEALNLLLSVANELMEGSQRGNAVIGNDVLKARFALMEDGEREADYSHAAATLGRIKSERKAAASRENGKKGGRPRKKSC